MNWKRNFVFLVWVGMFLTMFPSLRIQAAEKTGINSLEEITLGGIKQWILMRGEDVSNPVLLYLHGGPGFTEMPFTHVDSQRLEKHFVVVNWDQRGCGKSFDPDIPKEAFSLDQFLSDTRELISMLRKRFSKDRIYLLGHSWGSILGLYTAFRHPEYLHAYIGMGQVVNAKEGERVSYRYTLEKAREAEDEQAIRMLEAIDPPLYEGRFQDLSVQRMYLGKYGGSFRSLSFSDFNNMRNASPYYTEADNRNFMRAFAQTCGLMWRELMEVDFFEEIKEVEVPVYFFVGRYDYQTPFELVERYFEALKAPHKEMVWFGNSAHMPNLDEPDVFQEKLIDVLLEGKTEKYEGILKAIDTYVEKAVKEWESPGLAVAIVKDDAIVFSKGYGVREIGKPQRVDENTLFAVGSQTKAFTAAALAMLVDEGKLGWDDPLTKHLPGFKLSDPWVTSRVTVRDCLTHRVGFEPLIMPWILTDFKKDELLWHYRHARSLYGFRSTFDYNNTMFIAAGQIIPAVTGKSWDEFVKERIFDPLGMRSSGTSINDFPEGANLTCPHEIIDGRIRPIPWRDMDCIGPAGSINSNISDMARWLRFQLGKGQIGGKRLLSTEAVREMHSPQQIIKSFSRWGGSSPEVCYHVISLPQSRFLTYGLGWFVQDYRRRVLIHHGGDAEGMRCQAGMIPEMNLGVVVFSNLHPATLVEALLYRIFDSFIGGETRDWSGEVLASVKAYRARMANAQEKAAAATVKKAPPSLALENYAGLYENDLYGRARVTLEQGRLVLHLGRIRSFLEHIRSETFRITEPVMYVGRMPVTFSRSTNGKPESINVLGILTFTRKY